VFDTGRIRRRGRRAADGLKTFRTTLRKTTCPADWLPQPQDPLLLERDSGLQHLGDIAMPSVLTAVQALNSGLLKVDAPVAPV